MFPLLKSPNFIFLILIITIQISLILSEEEKCYSIQNCIKCPELDYCEECEKGYARNKAKTKCGGGKDSEDEEIKSSSPSNSQTKSANKSSSSSKNKENSVLNKPNISVNKAPNNPFQNIPISSLQRFKDKDANNEIINKILIFILIILILSIIASVVYNFVKKKMNKGYTEEDGQEETAKVVYIR